MNADKNSQEKVYQFLKTAILDLEYKPNQRLTAQQVADRLGVSRTPVREAFGRLEQEGLVERSGGWGYAVRSLSVKEVLDLYKVREVLELEAVREAVPRVTPAMVKRMRAQLARAEQSVRRSKHGEFRQNTRAFYRELAVASGNTYLQQMLSLIDDRIRWLGAVIADRYLEKPRESLQDNLDLLAALERGDRKAAVAATKKHIEGTRMRFLSFVGSGEGPIRI